MRAIRVLSLNLWNDQGDVERRMSVLLPQLVALEPHVIALQEVRMSPRLRQAEIIAEALHGDFRFAEVDPCRERGAIGNAIVSRLPILSHAVLELPGIAGDPRNALKATIDTPAGSFVLVTTHLRWQLDGAPVREEQVVALDEFARLEPGPLPTVLCGDFNCSPDSDVYRFLTGRASLHGRGTYWRDAFQNRHPHDDGFTWSAANPLIERSVEPERRIDFVFVAMMRDDGPGAVLDSRVVLDVPGEDDVFASDHFGVYAEIATVPVEGGF
jgi:maltose 6'-phosphate phosphatase